jgi:hypothetical protein
MILSDTLKTQKKIEITLAFSSDLWDDKLSTPARDIICKAGWLILIFDDYAFIGYFFIDIYFLRRNE